MTGQQERPDWRVQVAQYIIAALVLLALIGGVVFLIDRGKDVAALMTLVTVAVVPVLGALLYGKMSTVEKQSNGNLSRLVELLDKKTADQPASPPRE